MVRKGKPTFDLMQISSALIVVFYVRFDSDDVVPGLPIESHYVFFGTNHLNCWCGPCSSSSGNSGYGSDQSYYAQAYLLGALSSPSLFGPSPILRFADDFL